MTLDRNYNHPLSSGRELRDKAMALYSHINTHEYCGLDNLSKLILYLFFAFLTYEDRVEDKEIKVDIKEDLSYEDLTELAYRAKWIERENGMEGDDIFSFISSLRDKIRLDRREATKRGFEESSSQLFSPVEFTIEKDEIPELFSFIWKRNISNHFSKDEVKLSEKILSVSDGDYIYMESKTLPGLFTSFGKEKDCDVLISVEGNIDRTLSKMLLLMTVPENKWKRYRVVEGVKEKEDLKNRNSDGIEYPNKIISYGGYDLKVRMNRSADPSFDNTMNLYDIFMENGTKTLLFASSSLLSFGKGLSRKWREKLFNYDSFLSVVSFYRRYSNLVLLDKTKNKDESVLMLNLDESDIVFDDETCSEISAALNGDIEGSGELGKDVFRIKRDMIEADDYMLYPPYFKSKEKVGEVRELAEIDEKLKEKYRSLDMLCKRMAR